MSHFHINGLKSLLIRSFSVEPRFEMIPYLVCLKIFAGVQMCFLSDGPSLRYDPRHNSWASIQPLQQQHADHCVCVVGGHIYAIGGRDYSCELDSVERYDPSTNMWQFVSSLKREVRPVRVKKQYVQYHEKPHGGATK